MNLGLDWVDDVEHVVASHCNPAATTWKHKSQQTNQLAIMASLQEMWRALVKDN